MPRSQREKDHAVLTVEQLIKALPVLVKRYRDHRGIGLKEAGDEIGIHYTHVWKIEQGRRLNLITIMRLLRWLYRGRLPSVAPPIWWHANDRKKYEGESWQSLRTFGTIEPPAWTQHPEEQQMASEKE
jgi:hypothetical protein